MTFWQENYSFIKEVYDTRYAKMVEWMDNVEMAIQKVCASRVYTSAEFKREKDNFHVRGYASSKWPLSLKKILFYNYHCQTEPLQEP